MYMEPPPKVNYLLSWLVFSPLLNSFGWTLRSFSYCFEATYIVLIYAIALSQNVASKYGDLNFQKHELVAYSESLCCSVFQSLLFSINVRELSGLTGLFWYFASNIFFSIVVFKTLCVCVLLWITNTHTHIRSWTIVIIRCVYFGISMF